MGLAVIATMGTSPPVVTEFVNYVERTERIGRLVILYTSEPMVVSSSTLAQVAVQDRYPGIQIELVRLPVSDISDEEDNYVFMEEASRVMVRLRSRYGRVYVCLAGGRKEMVASMVLLSQLTGIVALYHVVSPKIREMNVELERLRSRIEELASSPDPLQYYRDNKELFEPLMYPPPDSYNVVRVPTIPYPRPALRFLVRLLGGGRARRSEAVRRLGPETLESLKEAGLVSLTRMDVIATDEGRRLYERVLKDIL